MIQIKDLKKTYHSAKGRDTLALKGISFDLPKTGLVMIVGKSGCGKTTLINCIAGIEVIDSGEILVDNQIVHQMTSNEKYIHLNHTIGLVFQDYNLIDDLTVGQNIGISLSLQGQTNTQQDIESSLKQVDLEGYQNRKIYELSGGQKQRVAIARTIAKQCKCILADEPTGNLDEESSEIVWSLLQKLSTDKLVVVITHDNENAHKYGDRIIKLKDGLVDSDIQNIPTLSQPNGVVSQSEKNQSSIDSGIVYPQESMENDPLLAVADSQKPISIKKQSNLSIRYCAKLGLNIWTKKRIRLIFTILLPLISFLAFSLSFTLSRYDDTKVKLNFWQSIGIHNMVINETHVGSTMKSRFDLSKIRKETTAYGVTNVSIPFWLSGLPMSALLRDASAGSLDSMVIDNNDNIEDIGWNYIQGHSPQTMNQIAITDVFFQTMQRYGVRQDGFEQYFPINTFEDLQDKVFYTTQYEQSTPIKIPLEVVGIVNTKINIDKFYDPNTGKAIRVNVPKNKQNSEIVSSYSLLYTQAFMKIVHKDLMEYTNNIGSIPANRYDEKNLANVFIKSTGNLQKDKAIIGKHEIQTGLSALFSSTYSEIETFFVLSLMLASLFLIFTFLIIANFVSSSIKSSQKLIGILRSMGTKKSSISLIFIFESLITSVIIAVLTMVAMISIVIPIFTAQNLPSFAFASVDILLFLIILGMSLLASAVSSFPPLILMNRKPIIEIIKKA